MTVRNRRLWTDDEIRILRQLYGVIYAKDIARILDRSVKEVYRKAYELGLRSKLSGKHPKLLKHIIAEQYNNRLNRILRDVKNNR